MYPGINNMHGYMHMDGFTAAHKCFTGPQKRATKGKDNIKTFPECCTVEQRGWHARKALMAH